MGNPSVTKLGLSQTSRIRRKGVRLPCIRGCYVALVEYAERVITRLRRIEALERERAPARTVLAEVRELLVEAERWVREERWLGDPGAEEPVAERLADVLDRCRTELERGRMPLAVR